MEKFGCDVEQMTMYSEDVFGLSDSKQMLGYTRMAIKTREDE
jgi:hypothetical protein